MKKVLLLGCLLGGLCVSQSFAQNSGDEQGLEVPENLQLQADKDALRKAYDGWWKESRKNYEERMAWYNQAKFGCFIHWGPSSVQGGVWKGRRYGGYTEHLMRRVPIPLKEYKEEVVAPFNPSEFDADEWMRNARDAGMKYFIITAKHHDGFAMHPSDVYPYDMRMTAYKGGDIMEELRQAAKKYGLKFGFYYSHAFDWEHPDAPGNDWDYGNPGGDKALGGKNWWMGERKDFLPRAEKYVFEKSIPQIQELVRKYQPDILWFDTPHKLPLYLNIRILEAIREVDPENKIVVNGRLARFSENNLGDYLNTGDRAAFFPSYDVPWESIPTTNESYGYSAVDNSHKSVKFFIQLLASAASKGGNILLNVGPMGNGKWDERDTRIFKGIGEWLKVNGESIYGSRKSGLPIPSWGVTTLRGDTLYAHVYRWPEDGKLVLGGLRSDIQKAWLVKDKKTMISAKRINSDDYVFSVPVSMPDTLNTVIAMKLKGGMKVDPIRLLDDKRSNTLYTFDAELHGEGLQYGDGKPQNNYVRSWKSTDQWMSWKFRLNAPAEYDVYLDYNPMSYNGKSDGGTVVVEIAGKDFVLDYAVKPGQRGAQTLHVGKIRLDKGVSECTLKGRQFKGSEFMCPIAVRLEK